MGLEVLKTKAMPLMLVSLIALGACAPRQEARPAVISSGPDEFSNVPYKTLQAPEAFDALPAPTPQGANLADATPKADAIAALGGRATGAGGVDGGIVNYASRYGVDPAIRSALAQADSRKGRGWGLFSRNKYERAYRRFALDPYAEWERLRAMGVKVPAAPPER